MEEIIFFPSYPASPLASGGYPVLFTPSSFVFSRHPRLDRGSSQNKSIKLHWIPVDTGMTDGGGGRE